MSDPCPVVFLGTPHAAVTVLDAIVEAGHPVLLVVSRRDARRGRGSAVSPSPVKERAIELGLETTDDPEELHRRTFPSGTKGVVVAYGRIIPAALLGTMPMLNVHFSLLPRWRGAAPVERAILAGDERTGVCVMGVEEGLDTGPVFASEETAIGDLGTAALTDVLARMGARLLLGVLADPAAVGEPQTGEATYAAKISPADLVIDWGEPAAAVLRRVRAVAAHTVLDGRRVRIVQAEPCDGSLVAGQMSTDGTVGTGNGCVRLLRVRPESRVEMDAAAWLRGLNAVFPVRLG
ncbi:MAG: methionyl-tRNA formyltransferase [Ilumatobacteraceae bacterium]